MSAQKPDFLTTEDGTNFYPHSMADYDEKTGIVATDGSRIFFEARLGRFVLRNETDTKPVDVVSESQEITELFQAHKYHTLTGEEQRTTTGTRFFDVFVRDNREAFERLMNDLGREDLLYTKEITGQQWTRFLETNGYPPIGERGDPASVMAMILVAVCRPESEFLDIARQWFMLIRRHPEKSPRDFLFVDVRSDNAWNRRKIIQPDAFKKEFRPTGRLSSISEQVFDTNRVLTLYDVLSRLTQSKPVITAQNQKKMRDQIARLETQKTPDERRLAHLKRKIHVIERPREKYRENSCGWWCIPRPGSVRSARAMLS